MKLIKLNAIDSTNEYIKKIKTFVPDKLFCVYTYNQKQGKGQRANIWPVSYTHLTLPTKA